MCQAAGTGISRRVSLTELQNASFRRGNRMNVTVTVTVNGKTYQNEVEPRLLLVHYLRDVLSLTGTHVGCDTSQCGACTIIMDGAAVKSCTVIAAQADGAELQTT